MFVHEAIEEFSSADALLSKRFCPYPCALAVKFFVLLWYSILRSCSWLGLWRHCWHRQCRVRMHYTDLEWDPCTECPLGFAPYLVTFLFVYSPCYKSDSEWLPVHCGDQRHLRVVPCLRPCTRQRFVQGLRPKHNHLRLSSAQCRFHHLIPLIHSGPVTQYCGGSILYKNSILFTMKEFPQI